MYDNESLVWGRRNVFTGSPGHEVLRAALNPGLHRLRITVEVPQRHALWINNIVLSTGTIIKPGKLILKYSKFSSRGHSLYASQIQLSFDTKHTYIECTLVHVY